VIWQRKRGPGEGCIFQRNDGRWCGVITTGYENGKQLRKSFYGENQKDVQEQVIEALAEQQKAK